MNRKKAKLNLKKYFTKSRSKTVYVFLLVGCLLVWGWLPFVEVSKLSASMILGRGMVMAVYAVIAGISFLSLYLAVRQLIKWYRNWQHPEWQFLVVVFFVWSAIEWLVSWLVTVIWFGEGSSIDSVLPFTSLTPFLMYTPLGLLTRFVGFHGLSALVIVVATAIFTKRMRRYALPLILSIAILTGISWYGYRQAEGVNINATVTAEHLGERLKPFSTSSDLVVLPEYGFDAVSEDELDSRLRSEQGKEVYFVGSRLFSEGIGVENRLIFGSTKQGFIEETPKSRLIPGGEYLPFLAKAPLEVFGADNVLQKFAFTRTIKKGETAAQPFKVNANLIIGAEACASIITPNDYRLLTKQGSTVLVNSASLEIFRSPVFDVQHQGLARFMAVANARPMLQSANSGSGFALDHNGRLLAYTDPVGMKSVTVKTNTKTTPYQKLGEWTVYIGATGLVLVGTQSVYSRLKSARDNISSSKKGKAH